VLPDTIVVEIRKPRGEFNKELSKRLNSGTRKGIGRCAGLSISGAAMDLETCVGMKGEVAV
jgi:carbohydrate-selective porin OprB